MEVCIAQLVEVRDPRARKRTTVLLFSLLIAVAALLRVALALHQGLWVDEVFSLAMATGHSLEHPAAAANAALGDYVEPAEPQPPSALRCYMQHDTPPAGLARVVRAVRLSDTNPPLYYLLLSLWTRLFGTNDAALRLFSAACAIACFPLLWLLGLNLGGVRTAWASCILFAFSPLALYYSAEGRMYSLVWLLALSLGCTTLALAKHGYRPHLIFLWILSASAGLLTHYFFAFVLAACVGWMLLHGNRVSRVRCAGLIVATGLLVSPWYLGLPGSMNGWRVSAGWLDSPLTWREAITNLENLTWSYLSVSGIWGGARVANTLALTAYVLLMLWACRAGPRLFFTEQWRMVWLWVSSSILGLIAFDLLGGTSTSAHSRYALPGLPAAILLVAMGASLLPRRAQIAFLVILHLIWLPGIRQVFAEPSRPWNPFLQVGHQLSAQAEPNDLIIVHSIPSGVLGVARYMDASTPIASWVGRLGQRHIPDDIERLVASRSRVALVRMQDMREPAPPEDWLLEHWRLQQTYDHDSADLPIQYFVPPLVEEQLNR